MAASIASATRSAASSPPRAAQGQGLLLVDGNPKIGAHDKPVLFLHPKDLCGTLVELEPASWDHDRHCSLFLIW